MSDTEYYESEYDEKQQRNEPEGIERRDEPPPKPKKKTSQAKLDQLRNKEGTRSEEKET